MKRWLGITASVVFVFGVGAAWLLASDSRLVTAWRAAEPEVPPPAQAGPGPEGPAAAPVQERADPWREQLAGEFLRVAEQYEQNAQYPPYSLPIQSGDLSGFRYNVYSPVSVPQETPAGELEVRIVLEQLHFQKGDPIVGMVSLSGPGAEGARMTSASLIDTSGEKLYSGKVQPAQGGFAIVLQPSATVAKDWPRDLLVKVSGRQAGQPIGAVAPVKLNEPVGKVTSVGSARVEGAHLMIPVETSVESEGDYAISGNLYSSAGQPLVHIQHEVRLSQFDNETRLKVHRSALEAAGDEGPYELKDLMIRRLPAMPGDQTQFGPVVDRAFQVEGFSFDRYADTAYQDPLREARLEFLRRASRL